MSGASKIMKRNCRTCLSYFNETNTKCSLMNYFTSDSGRLELLKNVMTTCSVTLLTNEDDQLKCSTFICSCCMAEIDQMLNFLQKCIRSEIILKEASEMKTEMITTDEAQEENDSSILPKIELKDEGLAREGINHTELDVSHETTDYPSKKNNNEDCKLECQECHKTFPSALSLTFHRYKHPGYKPHTCMICHENFRTLQLIKKHMGTEHGNGCSKQYICRQCSEVFISKYHLTLHEQKSHNSKYLCGVCKRNFSTVSSLKFHENIHLCQGPHSYSLTTAGVLRDHKASLNPQTRQFECHCGRSFNRKKKLELHIESIHEKKKLRKHSCPECDKKFHHPYSLKNHLNSHLGIKPFLCNVCGSAFTALSNLTSHFRRIHSGEKQPAAKKYLCHTCGDSFARAAHLQRHTLRKHIPNAEKKHECPVCKKKFLEKSDVMGHVKLHDGVKPFVCDQCSKCFRTAWRLQAHVNRVHLGLRPFECLTCSVKFKTKSHLEKHIRTHTGEKPFPCPHCAYTCAEKSNLKKHINIHLKAI